MIKQTFLGIPEPPREKAKAAIIPVPWDAMVSYGKGAGFGPDAIIGASQQVETYDEELKRDLSDLPLFLRDPVPSINSSPEVMMDAIEEVVAEVAEAGQIPVLLGGDHSVSIAPTRYFAKKYKGLGILHLDAHSDLRSEWEGSPFSHACALRPAYDLGAKLVQVGIRSTTKEIEEECREHRKVFWGQNVPVKDIIDALPEESIYITVDVDVFDPSVMPATGTPEPGGLYWNDVLKVLRCAVEKRNVVGFDVVELSPIAGLHYPEFTIARLLTKFFGYLSMNKKL